MEACRDKPVDENCDSLAEPIYNENPYPARSRYCILDGRGRIERIRIVLRERCLLRDAFAGISDRGDAAKDSSGDGRPLQKVLRIDTIPPIIESNAVDYIIVNETVVARHCYQSSFHSKDILCRVARDHHREGIVENRKIRIDVPLLLREVISEDLRRVKGPELIELGAVFSQIEKSEILAEEGFVGPMIREDGVGPKIECFHTARSVDVGACKLILPGGPCFEWKIEDGLRIRN